MYNGVIVLDKIYGALSRGCVSAAGRVFGRKQKLGHAGTLDSSASGTLVLLAGYATRLCDAVMNLPKSYCADVQFGWETSTDDATGEALCEPVAADFDEAAFWHVIPAFLGVRMQRPPRISAVMVNGQRAHKIARSGEEPQIKERPVDIASVHYLGQIGPGKIRLRVNCHKGVYVRSLARDLGRRLGCGAHLASLRRLNIGAYSCENALPFNPQEPPPHETLARTVLPVSTLADHYYCYRANEFCEKRLINCLGVFVDYLSFKNAGVIPIEQGIAVLGTKILCIGELRVEDERSLIYPRTNIPLEVLIN